MKLALREARPGDERAIQQVVADVLREYDFETEPDGVDADLRDIQASYIARGGTFLVLVDEAGRVVGCGGVYPFDSEIAEVRKSYLLPGVRGRGWGRTLLLRLVGDARSRGFKKLVLETASKLVAADKLYRSVGFAEVEREHLAERCDRAMELSLRDS